MTEENQQHFASGNSNPETTLVTPIFDERAAETAQPVVPLATNAGGSSFVARTAYQLPGVAANHPSWMVGLILASILVGSVLGGLGLRFYQKRQSAASAAAKATPAIATDATEQSAPADSVPAPVSIENSETETAAQTSTEPEPSNILISDRKEIPAETSAPKPAATDERDGGDAAAKKPEKESKSAPPAVERKRADDDGDDEERARKERDQTTARRARNTEPRNQRTPDAAVRNAGAEPRARMVDSITIESQRIRRQERRRGAQPPARQAGTVDRVRGIFEGQSPR